MDNKSKEVKKENGKLHIGSVSNSVCKHEFSDRYWDKNGSKCIRCGKIFD